MVNFVIRHDKKKIFRFAPLQSDAAAAVLKTHGLTNVRIGSFILVQDGKVYEKSDAAIKVCESLSWWIRSAKIFYVLPKFIRNGVYDFVAKRRYKWFGRKETCMVPTDDVKSRFLS
jgi:predicted DCC family thiol-disulfide oxidoreductase YuxK